MPSFQIKSLKIHKFLTLQNTEIDFSVFEYPILVLGMNLDLQRSNGAGKTTFLNAISYLKFGEAITEVPADFYEGTHLYGILVDTETGNELVIERKRSGKSNIINASYNNEEIQGNTPSHIQAKLNKLFGIKDNTPKSIYFQDYISTTYISNATIDTFASDKFTPQERMDLICRMLDLEIWDRGITNAKEYKRQVSKDIEVLDLNIKYIIDNFVIIPIANLQTDLSARQSEQKEVISILEIQKQALINLSEKSKQYNIYQIQFDGVDRQIVQLRHNYQQQVSKYNAGIANSQQTCDDAKKWLESVEVIDIEALNKEYESNQQKITAVQSQRSQIMQTLGVTQETIKSVQKQINQIDIQIKQTQTCPECQAKLLVDSSNQIHLFDIKTAAEDKNQLLAELEIEKRQEQISLQEIEVCRRLIADYNLQQTEIQKKQQLFNQIQKNEESIKVNLDRIKVEYKNLEDLEKHHNQDIKRLCDDKEDITAKIGNLNLPSNWKEEETLLKQKIDTLYNQQTICVSQINLLEDKIQSYNENIKNLKIKQEELKLKKLELSDYIFWIDGFTTIKRNLIDGFIPLLEQATNDNIRLAGMDFTIALNTIKETKAGEARQKFNITVLDAQGLERPVNSYSAGERKTMAICLSLAIRDYKFQLGMLSFSFIMFDEVTDGLDAVGQSHFSELLKNRDEQCMVISHSDYLQSLFPSNITIVKQEGISTITYL